MKNPNTFDDSFNKLVDIDLMYKNFKKCKEVSGWKQDVQRFEENIGINLIKLRNSIIDGTYSPKSPEKFITNERGKMRCIESYCIEDRIVQSTFTREVLLPICMPYLIYDNAASLPNRGTEFFRNRFEKHLKDYINKYGIDGYILIGDFTKFFDNIRHDTFLNALENFGASEKVLNFTKLLLKSHEIDVSYMSDGEYLNCMNIPFNAINYIKNIKENQKTGEKIMRKSMGIGSYDAQIAGIISPYIMDDYIKIVKGIKGYGRYMDDFYIIYHDKEYLKNLLTELIDITSKQGFFLNLKKTQIVKLTHQFTLLKVKYKIQENGKIIKSPDTGTFVRERRKLKKFKYKLDNLEMTIKQIECQYLGWRWSIVNEYGEFQSIKNIDSLYKNLFCLIINDKKRKERNNGCK